MYLCISAFSFLNLLFLVKSECSLKGEPQKKNYTILHSLFCEFNVIYVCVKGNKICGEYNATMRINGTRNDTEKNYMYIVPNSTITFSANDSTVGLIDKTAKSYITNDIIELSTDTYCTNVNTSCKDYKLNLMVYWNNSQTYRDISTILYKNPVEEWTFSREYNNHTIRYLTFNLDDQHFILQLVKKKHVCGRTVWTTDVENVYADENHTSDTGTKGTLSQYLKPSNVSKRFCRRKSSTMSSKLTSATPAIENAADEELQKSIDDFNNVSYILLILLIILMTFVVGKFVCGVLANCFILKHTNEVSDVGLLIRSFSQNLTHQQMLLSKVDPAKEVFYTKDKKESEGVYEVNEFYNEI